MMRNTISISFISSDKCLITCFLHTEKTIMSPSAVFTQKVWDVKTLAAHINVISCMFEIWKNKSLIIVDTSSCIVSWSSLKHHSTSMLWTYDIFWREADVKKVYAWLIDHCLVLNVGNSIYYIIKIPKKDVDEMNHRIGDNWNQLVKTPRILTLKKKSHPPPTVSENIKHNCLHRSTLYSIYKYISIFFDSFFL